MLRSTGVAVFRSPFHFLYCQTYRGGLSIYRKFRVEISTRSAYLFGASIIRGASGRHIGNFRRTFIFHCVALLSVYSWPGICSGGFFFKSTRWICISEPGNISAKNAAIASTSFGTSNASGFLYSFPPGWAFPCKARRNVHAGQSQSSFPGSGAFAIFSRNWLAFPYAFNASTATSAKIQSLYSFWRQYRGG